MEGVAVGFDLVVGVGFGLNAIPNRSALDFIAFCSAVNSVVVEPDSGCVGCVGSEVVYYQLEPDIERISELTGADSVVGVSSSGAVYY